MLRTLILILLFTVFQACIKKTESISNELRFPIEGDPNLDWSTMNDHVSFEVLFSLQEGLLNYTAEMGLVPGIASHWTASKDLKEFHFYLRKAQWSDGRAITASDFVFAWQRLLDPKRASEYAYFLYDVENAEEFNRGKITNPSLIGVKALSDTHLVVKLKHPVAFFLHLCASPLTSPHRKDITDKHPTDFTEPPHLQTTGPYRLQRWDHDSQLILERNPYYYGPKPSIEIVKFLVIKEDSTALSMYELGALDVVPRIPSLDIDRVKNTSEFKSLPALRGYYFGFNTQLKPFDSVLVRQALASSIDRKDLVNTLRGGQIPQTSWVPQGMFGYEKNRGLEFNIDKAKALLASAGYPNGKNFPDTFLMYDSLDLNKLVAEKIQFQWKKNLNIQVRLVAQELKVYLTTLTQNTPPIFRMGWGADYPDAHNFLDLFTSNSGNNTTKWANLKYDALITAGLKNKDEIKRLEIYSKAQKLLLEEDTVIIPLFQTSLDFLVKPYIQNFTIDPLEYPRISEAKITDKNLL